MLKNITKKDVLIFACLAFVFYKLNGIQFNISGKSLLGSLTENDCGCHDK